MRTVQEIEAAIIKLKPREIMTVTKWLDEVREEIWDRQIESDAKSGELDKLIKKAKTDYRTGKSTRFP
jgi:hypothetical protein